MNLNEYPEELRAEEQRFLDALVRDMDVVINELDDRVRKFSKEAKDAMNRSNPDEYLAIVLAQKGIKDTAENRKKFIQSRDELYHTRMLLECEDLDTHKKSVESIQVGLHACQNGGRIFVTGWTMPVCRHYLMDNASTSFEGVVKDKKSGAKYRTKFDLLVKDKVDLRFTRVKKAMNLFPGIFDKETLEKVKRYDFFSDEYLDEMISRYNPDDYNPDDAAKIISDEFLQELLERRSNSEFKNIVFSIQKKQGDIIQAPYNQNMIIQGCAGSGKSMIMLHRLPIILYDNPNSLERTNLYIITPSQMYIQMAENMRHQLEISDINMGTINQYYDYCISKYHMNPEGYGKIRHSKRLSPDLEAYVYSEKCIGDIKDAFYYIAMSDDMSFLDEALKTFAIDVSIDNQTIARALSSRFLLVNKIVASNREVVNRYYQKIKNVVQALCELGIFLKEKRNEVERGLSRDKFIEENIILSSLTEIDKLDANKNAKAIENRKETIELSKKNLQEIEGREKEFKKDEDCFIKCEKIANMINEAIEPYMEILRDGSSLTEELIYEYISKVGNLIGTTYATLWEISRMPDKYADYLFGVRNYIERLQEQISILQDEKGEFLEYSYLEKIEEIRLKSSSDNMTVIDKVYMAIMEKLGVRPNENGKIYGLKCSPYIYLQILFQFQGAPNAAKEKILAIDEAQGLAPVELRLLSEVNDNRVIFNLFGDIKQHIEGTKGIDGWDEFNSDIKFETYNMKENYRNAAQITEYCNKRFGMDMIAINTSGKGVHELISYDDFYNEMITQLYDHQRTGLAAILVKNDAEARSLLSKFAQYADKFYNMTDDEYSYHRTRWNILTIDDSKGLEFSVAFVLAGRMTENEKYIAYTRALDELFVYENELDIKGFEHKPRTKSDDIADEFVDKKETKETEKQTETLEREPVEKNTLEAADKKRQVIFVPNGGPRKSKLREFFEAAGLQVIDKRHLGGRLWVIGEKNELAPYVMEAVSKFGIGGQFTSNKESGYKNGWCTKSNK